MTTFTTEDRKAAMKEPILNANWLELEEEIKDFLRKQIEAQQKEIAALMEQVINLQKELYAKY